MTAGAGLVHTVGFYASDEEFVQTFLPYCLHGLERDEVTVVRLEQDKADLLRSALGTPQGVDFLPHDDQYATAPAAMAGALGVIDRYRAQGAQRIRLLGELPALRGLGRDVWLRYEAAANRLLEHLPVDAVCACDRRTVSDAVHADLLRTHHAVATADGDQVPNPAYESPESFAAGRTQPVRDPLEDSRPALEVVDVTPADARRAVGGLAADMGVGPVDALLLAVSEVVGNAIMHGARPVVLRAWGRRGRLVVAVKDAGTGPHDPFVGLAPVEPAAAIGGLGLWIAHQVCPEIALSTSGDGFTVRLAAGVPHGGPQPR